MEYGLKEHELWKRALMFAAKAHDGGYRKGTQIPYIVHPIEVSFIVAGMTEDEEVIAAAALHDVVEDTPVTLGELEQEFGLRIAGFVAAETENKRPELAPDITWKLRKQESVEHLRNESKEVKMIALGDKLSNLRSTAYEYDKIGDTIWERFHQKDKAEHRWYYRTLLQGFEELRETEAWKEYVLLCDKIFGE